jgi:hypothetical protein
LPFRPLQAHTNQQNRRADGGGLESPLSRSDTGSAVAVCIVFRDASVSALSEYGAEQAPLLGSTMANIDHYRVTDDGRVVLADGAPRSAFLAVSKIRHRIRYGSNGQVAERDIEISLWDKPSMIKLAGKHVGVPGFSDRPELTKSNGKPMYPNPKDLSDDELLAEFEALLSQMKADKASSTG